ncbi:MAG: LacI family DNA-binding transcriptional regulator [Vibrio sp.]
MATITDVSLLANVSKATVSRVLSGSRGVREESRQAVLQAARALNYVPNVHAQNLATQENPYIGVVVAMSEMAAMQSYLPQLSYRLSDMNMRMLLQYVDNAAMQQSVLDDLSTQCQAVIVLGPLVDTSGYSNVLLLDKVAEQTELSVGIDYQFATQTACNYLLGQGHRQIALFTDEQDGQATAYSKHMITGYQAALENRAMPVNRQLMLGVSDDFEASCLSLLNRYTQFSAMIVTRVQDAAIAMRVLRDFNLYVPQDVSIICLEDSPLASQLIPQLTCIHHSTESLVDACMLRIRQLLGQKTQVADPVIQGRLICRESVQKNS